MSLTARTPGPWRSMPPRLAYVWLRGLVGSREPLRGEAVCVSAALLRKVRRWLSPARPFVIGTRRNKYLAFDVDGHRVLADAFLHDRAVVRLLPPPRKKRSPCLRIVP